MAKSKLFQPKSPRQTKSQAQLELVDNVAPIKETRNTRPIEAKNKNQQRYIDAIESSVLTFGTGPAGVGKTYISAALAAQALEEKRTNKIIITRPAVEAGESLGFLPGELDEKFDPYLVPFREVLNERLGRTTVDYYIKRGVIEAVPLAYMRGRSFHDCWVIGDEFQNCTSTQMKMFLTRIGYNCKAIVNGDESQVDIHGTSGLADAVRRLSGAPQIKVVEFTNDDCVRSGLVRIILDAYSD